MSEILFEDSAKKECKQSPGEATCFQMHASVSKLFGGSLALIVPLRSTSTKKSQTGAQSPSFFELEKTGGKTHPRNSILLGIQPPESASLLLSRGCSIKIVHGSRYFGVLCTHSSIKGPVNSFQRILYGPLYKLKILAKE